MAVCALGLYPVAARAQSSFPSDTVPDLAPQVSARALPPLSGKRLPLSLNECIDIALSSNPTVKVADMEVTRADYSKKETLAQLFPNVNFSGVYQRAIELQTVSMNMGGETQSFKMGSDNTWNFGFSVALPLVAPQLWKSLKLSDTQILQNVESARASRLDLINSVKKAYLALLLAKASYGVIASNYNIAVYNASVFRKRFNQGTATEYDTLRSAVQVKNIEPDLLQSDIAIRQARLQLKVLLNLEQGVDVDATSTLDDLRNEMGLRLNLSDKDLAGNTSLRSMDLQKKMLEQTVTLRKMDWMPTLSASFNYTWNSLNNGSPFRNTQFNPYSTLGLQLNVPIFSGGSKYYGLKGAKTQLAEIGLQRENLVNSLNMQVDLALDNIRREATQIEVSRSGMAESAKAYSIMQRSFDIGAATYLDLRDSELANTTAQLSYYQSVYNYLVSISELEYLLGKDYTKK